MIRKPLPRRATSIWDRPDDWPFEPPGWVFIASAIKELGKGDDEAGKKKLRELCALGRLRAAGLMRDGQLEVLAAHRWNTDACKKWFASCQVSLRELMEHQPYGGNNHALALYRKSQPECCSWRRREVRRRTWPPTTPRSTGRHPSRPMKLRDRETSREQQSMNVPTGGRGGQAGQALLDSDARSRAVRKRRILGKKDQSHRCNVERAVAATMTLQLIDGRSSLDGMGKAILGR